MTPPSNLSPLQPPPFDRSRLREGIVHLGIGGFHRAHMARYVHDLMLLDAGALRWGVVAAGLRDADRPLVAALNAQNGLYTLIERDRNGEERTVIGSILRAVDASASSDELLAIARDGGVAIVSLTVTEHGYGLDRATKRLDPSHSLIERDLRYPHDPRSPVGVVVAMLAARRTAGIGGLTVLSCDNIQHNGDVVRSAVLDFAALLDPDLRDWIKREATFPNAMVDRITPQPDAASIEAFRIETGIDDAAPLVTERFRQWVVEDHFVGDRPALERVGVHFVRDVTPYERVKLRLLNASHLALAGPAELMGITSVCEAVETPVIRQFVEALMDRETGPAVGNVEGVNLAQYKRSVIDRFANPAIPDTVARINADAPINYLLDPLRDRLAAGLSVDLLALALAAWLRRVRGEDDRGRRISVVHPLADELRCRAISGGADPRPLLHLGTLFGGLGEDEHFVAVVSHWLSMLYKRGAAAALTEATRQ